jgi:hypothetical protein
MRPVRLPVLVLALAAGSAFAQSHPCASMLDPDERLACYDKAFPPVQGAKPAVDAEARRAQALRDFGFSKVQRAERDPVRYSEEFDRIESTLAKLTYNSTGNRVLTLANGQVWVITEVSDKGWLKEGQPIVIKTAALGTYMVDTGRILLRARRQN